MTRLSFIGAAALLLVASALVKAYRPWPTLLGFLALTSLASAGLAWVLARQATTSEVTFGVAYCALTFFFNGAWPVLYVVTPAAFPTESRGAGFASTARCRPSRGLKSSRRNVGLGDEAVRLGASRFRLRRRHRRARRRDPRR